MQSAYSAFFLRHMVRRLGETLKKLVTQEKVEGNQEAQDHPKDSWTQEHRAQLITLQKRVSNKFIIEK